MNGVSKLVVQQRAIAAALAATAAQSAHPESILLTLEEVLAVVRVSRATWLRGVRAGIYPQPVRVSARKVFWRATDVERMLQNMQSAKKPPARRTRKN